MTRLVNGTMVAALLAATVLAPMAASATAAAQDAGWKDGRRDGGPGDDRRDGADRGPARPDRGPAAVQAQGQLQVQAGQPGYRDNGRDGRDGGRGPQGQPGGDPRGDWRQGGPGRDGDRGPDGGRDRGQYDGQRGQYDRGRYDGGQDRRGGPDGRGPDGRGPGGRGPDGRGYAPGQYGRGDRDRGPGYGDPRGGQGGWNRGWRQDGRYDWNGYRQQNRRAFGLPRYAAPGGWRYGYRRFSVGVSLNAALFGRSYWIQDPWSYRLPAAYGPYRWVRYYDDALLVDVRTGVVVDGVYGIFY